MFKRMQKLSGKLEKERKKGTPRKELGPPEMAMDDDSESSGSSSSGDSDGSSSSSEDSEDEEDDKMPAAKKAESEGGSGAVAKGKKEQSNDDDESSDSSSSSSSSSDDDDEDHEEREKSKAEMEAEEDENDTPVASIIKAEQDPIYIHPRAQSKAGFQHRSCYLCPTRVLKTEKSILVHLKGNSHGRRIKRFRQFCETKLTEAERKDPSEGGLSAKQVIDRIDEKIEIQTAKQQKHKQLVKAAKKVAKGKRMEIKKERRKKEKAIKEEKKQRNLALRDVPKENGKKRQITEDGETVRARKREKGKRVAKLKRVLPPKAERKAAKKERKEVKAAAKAAIRKKVAIERAKKRASREASRGGEGAS